MKRYSLVLAVALAACSGEQRIGQIDYEVTGGFTGQGDGTSMQITTDGAVTRQTLERGPEQGQLPVATHDDIVAKIKAADLPALDPSYGCGGCADAPVDRISVDVDGTPRVVAVDRDESSAPAELKTAIDAIRAAVDAPLQ